MANSGVCVHITGIVQGVGFRPFVYNLAQRYQLTGWVRNTSAGVDIYVEGEADILQRFLKALEDEAPPLSHIDTFTIQSCPIEEATTFEIHYSHAVAGAFQPISPDVALCDDCLRELNNPSDRRYRYPFINCTNCGPRFTIIQQIPYDRPATTMKPFDMCDACKAEYTDPTNRRFHAQPIACPECGPHVWLERDGIVLHRHDDALQQAVKSLRSGEIVAIRGLGGYHLACDATNGAAVARLRQRKGRPHKPFAVMVRDVESARQHVKLNSHEQSIISSRERPIVLLTRHGESSIVHGVAPNQQLLGLMLPYTPLHHLLFSDEDMPPLVMTSGNISGEPIITDNDMARRKLDDIVDAFLMHNRDIHVRTDDSVMRVVFDDEDLPVRRSRGYAPYPVLLPFFIPSVLAVGAEMKNTFCVTRDNYAFMSHHIGNMENYETLQSFEDGIAHFEHLFQVSPRVVAADYHPDYLASRYAQNRAVESSLPLFFVQHHHAHVMSLMAEHNFFSDESVLGVVFDGTGYGLDGTIWGGEFLLCDYTQFERITHLRTMPLPGGDASTRKPARLAYAYCIANDISLPENAAPLAHLDTTERDIIRTQIAKQINTPMTSSMGRLFDVVSSLLDVCHVTSYEGQAAIELESIATEVDTLTYPYDWDTKGPIDATPIIRAILVDLSNGIPRSVIATRFHNTIAKLIYEVSVAILATVDAIGVGLTGGVFQNVTLLNKTRTLFDAGEIPVYTHHLVPPNDGGLALGQAVIAAKLFEESEH